MTSQRISTATERLINEHVAAAISAYEAIRANENIGSSRAMPPPESAARECAYREFLSCKKASSIGTEGAIGLPEWFKELETEFRDLKVVNNDVVKYTNRFLELTILCPALVNTEYKKIERYIWGLPPPIQGILTVSEPGTIQKAIRIAHDLNDQLLQHANTANIMKDNTIDGKRKAQCLEDITPVVPINSYPPITPHLTQRNYKGNNPRCLICQYHHQPGRPCRQCTVCGRYGHHNNNCQSKPQPTQQPNLYDQLLQQMKTSESTTSTGKRKGCNRDKSNSSSTPNRQNKSGKTPAKTGKIGYAGTKPLCNKCNHHHKGTCASMCGMCWKLGPTPERSQPTTTCGNCYNCRQPGHLSKECPRPRNN